MLAQKATKAPEYPVKKLRQVLFAKNKKKGFYLFFFNIFNTPINVEELDLVICSFIIQEDTLQAID
jgi:hypothetical protein